ncbi:MAG: flagellin [Bacteroides sp.]
MRINANISAIISNNQLQKSESNLEKSLERLSSGYKINHASDDAAGMAISLKMKMQIRGLERSNNNASDGISVIQTSEGAISEIQSMLTRMKELAVQAANDTNTDSDRSAIQQEIDSLNKEIDRISDNTEFNTQSLINGNLERRVYTRNNVKGVEQFECSDNIPAGDYSIAILEDARQAVAMGSAVTLTSVTEEMAGTISINGYNVDVDEGDDLNTVMTKLSDAMGILGGRVFATAGNPTGTGDPQYAGYEPVTNPSNNKLVFMTNEYGSDIKLEIKCDNELLADALGIDGAADEDGVVAQGKDAVVDFSLPGGKRVGFADTANISAKGTMITVKDVDNKTFVMDIPGNIAHTEFVDVDASTVGKAGTVTKVDATAARSVPLDVIQQVTDIGAMKVHVGANEDQYIAVDIQEISTYKLGIDQINVMSNYNASRSIEKIDEATAKVAKIRSKLGSYENRIEHTQNNLDVSDENMTAALSRLIDTDMAEEMTEYTSQNVLAQAGTSILSQANARPETVLQLLQK